MKIRLIPLVFSLITVPPILVLALAFPGFAERSDEQDVTARFRRMSEEAEARGLAEPFVGVTTNGEVVPGLFEIRSTGVSTQPVRRAAETFLSALTDEQRERTSISTCGRESASSR